MWFMAQRSVKSNIYHLKSFENQIFGFAFGQKLTEQFKIQKLTNKKTHCIKNS